MFTEPRFIDDNAAREYLESLRWPNGPVCPHCGVVGGHYALKGESHRPGLYSCKDCREQFTVTVGTVFERSKVPLHKWVLATHLMCASKKGISSKQLERMLGVTYKTAWFMTHRIREAMKQPTGPFGTGGGTVEADETYWGTEKNKRKPRGGYQHKMKVVTLVERGGKARSYHVPRVDGNTLKRVLLSKIERDAHLMTDEHAAYSQVGKEFASHNIVRHSAGEYIRGKAHTNTVEGFFSILKRGLIGTFHHVGEQHLQRYVHEFDFRYNHREALGVNDSQRTDAALRGIVGKRLTYRRVNAAA